MGVHNLQSCVDEINLGTDVAWDMSTMPFPAIVVDGSGLMHSIYKKYSEWQYAGGYHVFQLQCERFLLHLLSLFSPSQSSIGVTRVFVILDGLSPVYKRKDDRNAQKIKSVITYMRSIKEADHHVSAKHEYVLPYLARIVFISLLRRLVIETGGLIGFSVSVYEADADIACLARDVKGVVIGQDSDFFIHDIPGYIPLRTIDISTGLNVYYVT